MQEFDKVHKYIRENRLEEAKILLFDNVSLSIKEAYRGDFNHAYYLLGDILYLQDNFKNALICFKKALLFCHDDYDAIFAIGNCYNSINLPYKAFPFYKRVYNKTGNFDALYNLANAYYDLGYFREAIDAYQEIPINERSYKLAKKYPAC